ncbi:tetratricopeptide repeat protein [Candidatus Levibacter sp. Uisw_134_01]|uniref:tetratricopeptide repeat protein n=1 Tax=Candidatus Levibacter sp. Uisw_134_01 TaxID=3230999 RepID=UPI003D393492
MSANLSVEQSLMKAKSYSKKGDLAEAQKLYETILKNFSNNIRAQQGLASLNKYKQNNVIQNPPQESVNQLVNLYNQGQMETVIKQAEGLTAQYPGAYVVWNILGASREEIGMFDESIYAYKKAIFLKSDFADAHFNMGVALKNQGKLDEAIEAYKKSISLKPSRAEAYNNMGDTLYSQGKLDEAIEAYKKSISLKPDYAEAYYNMGLALHYLNKLDEAIEVYKKSISLKPDFAEAHYNLGFTLLKSGRLKEGLDESEWRWKNPEFLSNERNFIQPMWDGSQSLKDKRILLWSEQGIGDTLNWSSCLSFLDSQAKHCILECQDKLVPLLQRSFPNVEVKSEDRSLDINRDDFDYHLPMGSLYRHFLSEITQNTKPKAYLVPDPDRVNYWRERLNSLGKGPYVGIGWKSTDMSPGRLPNYAPILEWSPVLKIPDVTFINLQYKDFEDDLAKVKDKLGVTVHNFDELDQFNNVDDTTALCAALDMLVSNHGTAPLISGAVGTPTKLANWKQSSWNTILNNPVGPLIDIYTRNTWETWDNVFRLIKEDILKINQN